MLMLSIAEMSIFTFISHKVEPTQSHHVIYSDKSMTNTVFGIRTFLGAILKNRAL
jgi:hypothetical protein